MTQRVFRKAQRVDFELLKKKMFNCHDRYIAHFHRYMSIFPKEMIYILATE